MNRGFLSRMALAVRAFRETFVVTGTSLQDTSSFEGYGARKVRYDVLAALYDNTVYRDIHSWAKQYRAQYGLYKAVRNIYNPTNRCVEFWKWMIWGGALSPEAKEEGSIPIRTEHQGLREAIAQLWKDSHWRANKDLVTMYGTMLGDAGIKIVDDPMKGQVRMEVIHPKMIKSLDLDENGFVKGYVLQEERFFEGRIVTFEEECRREGDLVVYETFKDGRLYPWNGISDQWAQEYGFVPFVAFQHIRTGLTFGWAEVHAFRSKINEVDDIASKLHDYIRKVVDPVWLFNFRKPRDAVDIRSGSQVASIANPQPVREELPAVYVGDSAAKGQALVSSEIDIAKAAAAIKDVVAELERDLPELQMDIWTAGQYTTGKALRNARQRVERKVIQRRPEYDEGLVRAHQMAIAIGGMKNYEGYQAYDLTSFGVGALDHTIPTGRPIFDTDETEELDKKKTFWDIVSEADKQGFPLNVVLADLGKSKDWIDKFVEEKKKIPPKPVVQPFGQTTPDGSSPGTSTSQGQDTKPQPAAQARNNGGTTQ